MVRQLAVEHCFVVQVITSAVLLVDTVAKRTLIVVELTFARTKFVFLHAKMLDNHATSTHIAAVNLFVCKANAAAFQLEHLVTAIGNAAVVERVAMEYALVELVYQHTMFRLKLIVH